MRTKILLTTLSIAASILLWGCSSQAPAQTPSVVTVEKTVPVEVTRIVQQTVEVTRQVVETSIVEVPVTVTPTATPQATSTPQVTPTPEASATPTVYYAPVKPTPTFPTEKMEGFAFLKLINETRNLLQVELDGPSYQTYTITGNGSIMRVVPWGTYSYVVKRDQQILYRGQIYLHNADKHEFKLYEDKAHFIIP